MGDLGSYGLGTYRFYRLYIYQFYQLCIDYLPIIDRLYLTNVDVKLACGGFRLFDSYSIGKFEIWLVSTHCARRLTFFNVDVTLLVKGKMKQNSISLN